MNCQSRPRDGGEPQRDSPARLLATPHSSRIAGSFVAAAPLLLAGLFPLRAEVSARWGWSGAWLQPVGDPHAIVADRDSGATPAAGTYRLIRGVSPRTGAVAGHQGADLSNGRGGGPVRAAANGLVVKVGGKGWNRGYGRHVVLAHRLAEGGLAYSVYAHLAPGSVIVQRGQFVAAGRVLGRVGMSGRATSPHLHLEIRTPVDPSERWENAPVVDPLAFIAARRRAARADSAWARPYLEWAECAALIGPADEGGRVLSRAQWWRALAFAARHVPPAVPAEPESLRAVLVAAGLLDDSAPVDASEPLGWSELAGDLARARAQGVCLPWSPVGRAARRLECRRRLGVASPSREEALLAHRPDSGPTLAEACLALADLAGDPPSPKKPPRSGALPRQSGE